VCSSVDRKSHENRQDDAAPANGLQISGQVHDALATETAQRRQLVWLSTK